MTATVAVLVSLSAALSLQPFAPSQLKARSACRIVRCKIVVSESVQSLRDALNAAVEVEDYAEAQRLKKQLDAAQLADAQADFDRAAPAAAVAPEIDATTPAWPTGIDATTPAWPTGIDATTPTSPTDARGGGFAFDTAAAPASAVRPIVPPEDATFVFSASSATPRSAKLPGAPAGSNGEYEVDVAWTPALQELVLAACVYAFDNIPPQETEQLLMGLVRAAIVGDGEAERSLRKLAALSRQLEALGEADRRGAPQELVADEARTLRSQIRMWGKDGERHMRADDSWLGYLKGLEEDAGW